MTEASYNSNSDKNFDFHIVEFKHLKEEIMQNGRIKLQIELYSISAAAILVSFFVAHQPAIQQSSIEFIWWSPLLVLYFGLIWSRSHAQRNAEIGQYLVRVEACFGHSELGWERNIAPLKTARGGGTSTAKRILWIGLFAFFALIAIKFTATPLWRVISG